MRKESLVVAANHEGVDLLPLASERLLNDSATLSPPWGVRGTGPLTISSSFSFHSQQEEEERFMREERKKTVHKPLPVPDFERPVFQPRR